MPTGGPFPIRESDQNQYYQIVVSYLLLAANTARLGISAANISLLSVYLADWNAMFPLSQNPDTATSTATDNKNAANKNLQALLRAIYADIPESALTAQDRNTLNLPARSKHSVPSPVPASKPIAKVNTSNRLEHTIGFVDEHTPNSRAKPEGVRGCQIWISIDKPVADPSDLTYLASDTATPYVYHFDGVHAGKTAYYWLRWENTRGETGPWSDVVMATITG